MPNSQGIPLPLYLTVVRRDIPPEMIGTDAHVHLIVVVRETMPDEALTREVLEHLRERFCVASDALTGPKTGKVLRHVSIHNRALDLSLIHI